ncbi:MAG TPA: hypothetical protein VI757_05340 [Bacteroidia bacterium]|nr:hypothetical protein [Bacteroidia bacterium]
MGKVAEMKAKETESSVEDFINPPRRREAEKKPACQGFVTSTNSGAEPTLKNEA